MKKLGTEIGEDGATEWRNNGGCIERWALYSGKERWEDVAETPETPHTAKELKKFCEDGGFKYLPAESKRFM